MESFLKRGKEIRKRERSHSLGIKNGSSPNGFIKNGRKKRKSRCSISCIA
jgi:hypothetical protein